MTVSKMEAGVGTKLLNRPVMVVGLVEPPFEEIRHKLSGLARSYNIFRDLNIGLGVWQLGHPRGQC